MMPQFICSVFMLNLHNKFQILSGHIAQSVTGLSADMCLAEDKGVAPGHILSWRLIMK